MTTIRKAPDVTGKGRVDFKPDSLDVLVYQKGLEVIWESCIRCPCKLEGRGFLMTCVNCAGSGYIFINPIETKMVVQNANLATKYSSWSLERIGMANITTRSVDNVGDMDRITLKKSNSKMSQVLRPKFFKHELFAFTNYPIISIIDVFAFESDVKKLKKIPKSKYSYKDNRIILNKSLNRDDLTITVRYTHPVQYYIVDIPREVRESYVLDLGKDSVAKLPVSAVGRRCHHVLRPDDFEMKSVVDNSYDPNDPD